MKTYPSTIFLAEDDNDDVLFFKHALNKLGLEYKLTVFSDGEEIIAALLNSSIVPDIIFVDINMPKLCGIEALKQIRTMQTLKDTPVITYSTSKNDHDILKAFEGGASLYLVKPSNIQNLVALVQKVFYFDWKFFKRVNRIEEFVLTA